LKKYLITEDQITHIYNCGYAGAIDTKDGIIELLKPIEPLDNQTIKSIMVNNGFKTYPEVGDDLKPYCYGAVRAIERHITGETQCA